MTYKELLEELKTANKDQLDQDVTIHLAYDNEYYPIQALCVAVENECDVHDAGHLVLSSKG